jgi:hypothetical protein
VEHLDEVAVYGQYLLNVENQLPFESHLALDVDKVHVEIVLAFVVDLAVADMKGLDDSYIVGLVVASYVVEVVLLDDYIVVLMHWVSYFDVPLIHQAVVAQMDRP